MIPIALSALFMACTDTPDMPELTISAEHEKASFLSVAGNSPHDVWAVGAQPGVLNTPVVIHWNGDEWTEIETEQLHPMWWVHPFEDGPTFISGGGATVLKITDNDVERTPTPPFFGNTVYGVWGNAPTDVWAVGGFAGRDGFIWRYDGNNWTTVALPMDLPRTQTGEIPALFKVWGRSENDVWFCGGLGTVLHWNGSDLSVIPTPTEEQLFTLTGNDDEIVVVGGSNSGVVLRGNAESGFVEDTPIGAPLLQGVTIDPDNIIYVAGAGGDAYRQYGSHEEWEPVALNMGNPQSVHAIWADCNGDVWGAGGTVLSPDLDNGLLGAPEGVSKWEPEIVPEPNLSCPEETIDRVPTGTIARRWIEQSFDSIRRDFPHPPVHARNLHHLAVGMFDAWAAYDETIDGYVHQEFIETEEPNSAREIAISYAALRILQHRFKNAIGGEISLQCHNEFMAVLGLDPDDNSLVGDSPIAVGNRIGNAIIDNYQEDGANETNNYEDTTNWETINPVMVIDRPGTNVDNVDAWQLLNLGTAQTQNGLVLDDAIQPYIGPQWREVEPFALEKNATTGLYSEIGDGSALVSDAEMGDWIIEVLQKTAELDVADGVEIDIGPGSRGNNDLGENNGNGYAINPVTGQPYEPNIVKRGDFTRVVAEMWADGPTSETPPGHWVKLAQEVSDNMEDSDRVPWGQGTPVDRLQWDVAFTFSVAAAVHDGAIAAWEIKRETVGSRPITLIRWMADNGQRSDPNLPNYHPDGLPLVEGVTELITEESSAVGQRHHHLRWHLGEVAVWSWPGEPGDRKNDITPLQWMRAKDWIPYQRRTFVTPAFPGFISGHSTFSRSAAVVMAEFTGSDYFPGGMHEFVAEENGYLKFEVGPSQQLRLQWATFFDASDEAGQSRLWGGIHVWPDDKVGRLAGAAAGQKVAQKAKDVTQGNL